MDAVSEWVIVVQRKMRNVSAILRQEQVTFQWYDDDCLAILRQEQVTFDDMMMIVNWPPRYNWDIVESGVKHYKPTRPVLVKRYVLFFFVCLFVFCLFFVFFHGFRPDFLTNLQGQTIVLFYITGVMLTDRYIIFF
jgi:hypothetical protein